MQNGVTVAHPNWLWGGRIGGQVSTSSAGTTVLALALVGIATAAENAPARVNTSDKARGRRHADGFELACAWVERFELVGEEVSLMNPGWRWG